MPIRIQTGPTHICAIQSSNIRIGHLIGAAYLFQIRYTENRTVACIKLIIIGFNCHLEQILEMNAFCTGLYSLVVWQLRVQAMNAGDCAGRALGVVAGIDWGGCVGWNWLNDCWFWFGCCWLNCCWLNGCWFWFWFWFCCINSSRVPFWSDAFGLAWLELVLPWRNGLFPFGINWLFWLPWLGKRWFWTFWFRGNWPFGCCWFWNPWFWFGNEGKPKGKLNRWVDSLAITIWEQQTTN